MAEHIDARFDAVEDDLNTTKNILTRVSNDVAILQHDMAVVKGASGEHRA
jgi:hypothetical protein